MPFYIHKPFVPQKTFVLNRTLHLTADGKVVEERDPTGRRVLGMRGSSLYEEEAKAYGLDDSHRLIEETPKPEPALEPKPEPAPPKPEPVPEPVPEPAPKQKRIKKEAEAEVDG